MSMNGRSGNGSSGRRRTNCATAWRCVDGSENSGLGFRQEFEWTRLGRNGIRSIGYTRGGAARTGSSRIRLALLASAAVLLATGAAFVLEHAIAPSVAPQLGTPAIPSADPASAMSRIALKALTPAEEDYAAADLSVTQVEETRVAIVEGARGEDIVDWVRGVLGRLLAGVAPADRVACEAEIAREAEQYRDGETIRVGGVTRIVVAKPDLSRAGTAS